VATLDGSNRVTSCPDLKGLAAATNALSTGPEQRTDALGRKFWRFENDTRYLIIDSALAGIDAKALTVFFVGRIHRQSTNHVLFCPRWDSYVSDASNVAYNAAAFLRSAAFTSGSGASTVQGGARQATGVAMQTGCQMQVIGVASRTTANGALRLYLNQSTEDLAQTALTTTAGVGGTIGGRGTTSNSTSVTASGAMDLYELVIVKGELTNTQADAIAAALVANYAIPTIANQILLEGDSITAMASAYGSAGNPGMRLTEPGSAYAVPANWRVMNKAVSSGTVASLVTRRDTTSPASALIIGGGSNVLMFQIGRNDAPTKTGAQIYAEIVALLNTTTTGYLQRGWSVLPCINIACANGTSFTNLAALRALMRDLPTFKNDTLTGPGQAHDGKFLGIADLPTWTVSGSTIFDEQTDALDTTYFNADGTHTNLIATDEMSKAKHMALDLYAF
jgi:hypothetical protein